MVPAPIRRPRPMSSPWILSDETSEEAGPALKVVEEGLQGLIEELGGGLGRIDVAEARTIPGPGVQLVDVQPLQDGLDVVGDGRPPGVLHSG
jgi:hypothetical protein